MRALVEVTSTLRERPQKWQNYQNCAGSGFVVTVVGYH